MKFTNTVLAAAGAAVLFVGSVDAANQRDESVYRAVEVSRAGALDLLKSIVVSEPAEAVVSTVVRSEVPSR